MTRTFGPPWHIVFRILYRFLAALARLFVRSQRPTRRFSCSRARPRQPVHRQLRRDLPNRRLQDPQDTSPHPRRERIRRAMDRINPPRTPRPHHHLEPSPARTRRHRLHRPLQPAQAAPIAPSASAHRHDRITNDPDHPAATNDPMRRPHQRIQKRCMTRHDRVSEPHNHSSPRRGPTGLRTVRPDGLQSARGMELARRVAPHRLWQGAPPDALSVRVALAP